MTALEGIRAGACVVHLVVTTLALLRVGRSPLAPVLALLGLLLLAWNSAALTWSLSHHVEWHWLEMTLSPLTASVVLHLVLALVGRRRELRTPLRLSYGALGALSLGTALSFVSPDVARFAGSAGWAVACLVGVVPSLGLTFLVLWTDLRRVSALEERVKAWLLMLALTFGLLLSATELLADLGFAVPRLSSVGTAVGAALLGVTTLRFGLLGRPPTWVAVTLTLALAGTGVLAQVLVFRAFGSSTAMLIGGSVIVTLAMIAAARTVLADLAVRSARTQQLAEIGRMAAQVAHDLKNPLAAMRGAAQFLREERAQGRSIDERSEFLDLMVEQIDRMHGVIDRYQQMLRVEAVLEPVALNELVRDVLALQRRGAAAGIEIVTDLAPDLPECSLDRGLVTRLLDNLLSNAVEAMPQGGRITVSTRLETGHAAQDWVRLDVEDTGRGLSPEAREHLFQSFFTTKAHGSGLGLAFVRRVVDSHGGEVTVLGAPSGGTAVRVRFPATPADSMPPSR